MNHLIEFEQLQFARGADAVLFIVFKAISDDCSFSIQWSQLIQMLKKIKKP